MTGNSRINIEKTRVVGKGLKTNFNQYVIPSLTSKTIKKIILENDA